MYLACVEGIDRGVLMRTGLVASDVVVGAEAVGNNREMEKW